MKIVTVITETCHLYLRVTAMMEDASKPSWMCTQDLTSALTTLSVHLLPGTHACGPEERIDCLLYKDGLPCCVLIVTMTLVVTLRWVTLRVFSPLLRLLFVGRRRDSPYAPAEDLITSEGSTFRAKHVYNGR